MKRYDRGRWGRPPEPWPEDAARWAAWSRDIVALIDSWRETEPEPTPEPARRIVALAPHLQRPATDETCINADCTVDWLFTPNGRNDPAWIARVRAELASATERVAS